MFIWPVISHSFSLDMTLGLVQEQGVGQGTHGDELHWTKVGSTAGVISGLSPGTEKDGKDL
jgi:hypothetical protein